eukprot:gene1214-biopygen34
MHLKKRGMGSPGKEKVAGSGNRDCFEESRIADQREAHPRHRLLARCRCLFRGAAGGRSRVLIAGGGVASAVIEQQCGDSGRSSRSFVVPSPRISRLCESATSASSHHGPASDTAPEVGEGRAEPWEEVVLRAASSAKLHAEPREVSLTLVVTNRCGFLPALADQIVPDVTSFFRREVTLFCDEVSGRNPLKFPDPERATPGHEIPQTSSRRRGCVGSLSADHFPATFGAVRACAEHQCAAARVALRVVESVSSVGDHDDGGQGGGGGGAGPLARLPVTTACCAGRSLCGDFGSESTQQWMVHSLSGVTERLAARWGVGVLIDSVVQAAVSQKLPGSCISFPRWNERHDRGSVQAEGPRPVPQAWLEAHPQRVAGIQSVPVLPFPLMCVMQSIGMVNEYPHPPS